MSREKPRQGREEEGLKGFELDMLKTGMSLYYPLPPYVKLVLKGEKAPEVCSIAQEPSEHNPRKAAYNLQYTERSLGQRRLCLLQCLP